MLRHFVWTGLLPVLLFVNSSLATNVSSVFGPVVKEGHKSLQYRYAYDDENERYSHRIHYQQSLNDDFRARLVVQRRENPDGTDQHDFVQGELLWQLDDIRDNWQQALRFDLRKRDNNRPNLFRLSWTTDMAVNERWNARFLVMSAVQIGGSSEPGLFMQTRASATYKATDSLKLALSLFNTYGDIDDIPSWDEQVHQLGPTATFSVGKWKFLAGYLAGLTDRTPDHTYRAWITRSF